MLSQCFLWVHYNELKKRVIKAGNSFFLGKYNGVQKTIVTSVIEHYCNILIHCFLYISLYPFIFNTNLGVVSVNHIEQLFFKVSPK